MRTTLEDLYYGNIIPNEQQMIPGSELKRAVDRVAKYEKQLMEQLKETDQEILTKLIRSQHEINSITATENFILGFRLGVRACLKSSNIEGCKAPPIRREEMQLLTREELQRLLIQAKDEGYYEVFLLELTTGLRVGELMALQWDDLNFKTGELRIERQVYRTKEELLIQEPKTKASIRTVILPPPVVEALKEYKKTVSSRWMFPSPKKEDAPLAPAAASHRLSKILTHAGCKKVRFHDLRHVFATNALEHGMDVKTLSTIIGHVSSATTLNVYAHVTDDMQRQAATKIDRGIGRAETPIESSQATTSHTMTDFKAHRGKRCYWGSGYLGRTKGGRWNGRYTVTWPDGTKRTRDIYADSEDECEKLLAVMITEMKTEVAAERERLRAESKAG